MAGATRHDFEDVYESFVVAIHDLYLTTKKSNSGSALASDQVPSAIERYDKAYLALRASAIESARRPESLITSAATPAEADEAGNQQSQRRRQRHHLLRDDPNGPTDAGWFEYWR